MFKKTDDPLAQELLDRIERLSKQVAELKGEKEAVSKTAMLATERLQLLTEIETLKIERARIDEEHARKIREVEHTTGLHRKQTTWEREKAVEEAKLTVQQENLSLDRQRFEEQMAFHKEQIKDEIDRLDGLLKGLMDRLPTVTVEKSIDFAMSNGKGA